jgi:phage anti-repressor protein
MDKENAMIQTEEEMASDIKQQLTDSGYDVNDVATAKEVIENYLNDDDVKDNAAYWANELNKRFNGNWFTLEKVQKKTIFKKESDAIGILQMLALSGLCHVTKEGKIMKYKITLDKSKKIDLLKKEKEKLAMAYQQDLVRINKEFEFRNNALDHEISKLESN